MRVEKKKYVRKSKVTKMIFNFFVYALVLYGSFEIATVIPVEEQITCNSLKCECECTGPALSKISCYFTDESVCLLTGVSTHLRSSKIEGRNVSIYIPDQDFEDSWSVIESFEIYGFRKNFRFHLPYRFTRKLHQITLFRLRNVSSVMTLDNVAFSNMTLLEHLDLSGNEFMKTEHLVHALTELTSVTMKTLNLSRVLIASKFTLYKTVELTPFTAVEKLTQQIPIIKHLDLSWTRAYFSFVELKSLPNLVTLNISGTLKNPFYGCVALQQHRRLEVLRMDNWPEVRRMNLPNAGNNSQIKIRNEFL